MRITLAFSLLCLAGAASLPAQVPVMHTVQPDSGKIGSVLKVQGVFLGKTNVDEVYLTDHTFDMKVKVLAQTRRLDRVPRPAVRQTRPAGTAAQDRR